MLILSDDAGYGGFGFTGSLQVETPHIDSIAETAIIAGGGELPTEKDRQLDGLDLMPYLNGADGQPHETLFWRMGFDAAVREGDWKLLRLADRPPTLVNT